MDYLVPRFRLFQLAAARRRRESRQGNYAISSTLDMCICCMVMLEPLRWYIPMRSVNRKRPKSQSDLRGSLVRREGATVLADNGRPGPRLNPCGVTFLGTTTRDACHGPSTGAMQKRRSRKTSRLIREPTTMYGMDGRVRFRRRSEAARHAIKLC